jgi:hypothetical protein
MRLCGCAESLQICFAPIRVTDKLRRIAAGEDVEEDAGGGGAGGMGSGSGEAHAEARKWAEAQVRH